MPCVSLVSTARISRLKTATLRDFADRCYMLAAQQDSVVEVSNALIVAKFFEEEINRRITSRTKFTLHEGGKAA